MAQKDATLAVPHTEGSSIVATDTRAKEVKESWIYMTDRAMGLSIMEI